MVVKRFYLRDLGVGNLVIVSRGIFSVKDEGLSCSYILVLG